VTVIGVFCLITAPFCAVNAVGIRKRAEQRSPTAASAESGPCGSVRWNVPSGRSATKQNVLLVIYAFTHECFRVQIYRRP